MGKPSVPNAPNYGPILDALRIGAQSSLAASQVQGDAAQRALGQQDLYAGQSATTGATQGQTAQDQRAWGQQQYNQMYPYLQNYMQSQLDFTRTAEENARTQTANAALSNQQARDTYNRYMTTYAPREDQFTNEAFQYASPARQDEAAGAARGDVATSFQQTQDAARRQLASYGVDPSQGAYGRTQQLDISRAAALAAAGTMARRQTEDTGRQYELAALNIGRQLPTQSLAQSGMGLQQATSALSGAAIGGGGIAAANNALTAGTNAMGSPTAYAGLANPYTQLAGIYGTQGSQLFGNQIQALGNIGSMANSGGNVLNNSFSNQLQSYSAQSAASPIPAIGRLVGTLAPMAFGLPPMGSLFGGGGGGGGGLDFGGGGVEGFGGGGDPIA